jgi:sulfur carrier protein
VIKLSINGEEKQFPEPQAVAELIASMGLIGKRIALECNGEIVPRSQFATHLLQDGDTIEIVVAVGGG